MIEKIKKILNENNDYLKSQIQWNPDGLVLEREYNRDNISTLIINEVRRIKIGMEVCFDDPDIEFDISTNYGKYFEITWWDQRIDRQPGEYDLGHMIIQCDAGEFVLPLKEIIYLPGEYSQRPIMSFSDFLLLVREDYRKAFRYFVSSEGHKMIQSYWPAYYELYRGFTFAPITFQDMEEFLVKTKCKDPVLLSILDQPKLELNCEQDNWLLNIEKSSWGFIQAQIRLHGHFLLCDKEWITPEDFIGNQCSLDIQVNKDLTFGNYYGAVEIMTRNQHFWLEVTYKAPQGRREEYIIKNKLLAQLNSELLFLFIARVKQENLSPTWYANVYQIIKSLKNNTLISSQDIQLLDLIDIHIHFLRGDVSVAHNRVKNIIESLESGLIEKNPFFEGYYLYLSSLLEDSKEYNNEVATILRDIYLANQEVFPLCLFLGEVDISYQSSPIQKLELYKGCFDKGCRSPFLYLQTIIILSHHPLVLRKLDHLIISSLEWAFKHNLLTEDLFEQLRRNAPLIRDFNQNAFRLLTSIYIRFKDKLVLAALCQLMIRNNFYEEKYFPWYEEGIKEGLNITRLYEYYMDTMPDDTSLLPKVIRLYFSYHPSLDWSSKAKVYQNVVASKDEDPETYEQNVGDILSFVKRQLIEGHISKSLAWLYNYFLPEMDMTPKMAKNLAKLWYTYEVKIPSSTNYNRLVVTHAHLSRQDNIGIKDNKAFVELYTSKDKILLQDEQGRKFPLVKEAKVEKFLDNPFLLSICTSLDVREDGYLLDLALDAQGEDFSLHYDNIEQSFVLYHQQCLTRQAKESLLKKQLAFLYSHREEKEIQSLINQADLKQMMQVNSDQLIELLNTQNKQDLSYQLIQMNGFKNVGAYQLIIVLNHLLSQCPTRYDKLWLHMSLESFLKNKYTESSLAYLCRFYHGDLVTMINLLKISKEFYVDVTDLEARIIKLLLLTGKNLRDYTYILEGYVQGGRSDSLVHAWLIRACFEAMRDSQILSDQMITFLENEYIISEDLEDTCRLAFLYTMVQRADITQRQRSILQGWLEDYLKEDIFLGIFIPLSRKFKLIGCKEDIFTVDYFYDAKKHLTFSYEKFYKGKLVESKEIIMNQVLAHLFQCQFILFYQEEIHYKIYEEGKVCILTEGKLTFEKDRINKSQSKYACINQMFMAFEHKDRNQIEKLIAGYLKYEAFADTQLQKVDDSMFELEEE